MESYEKKYNHALNMAKQCYSQVSKTMQENLACIFPELIESEDERIRKEIIDFICSKIDRGSVTKEQREKSDSWLAYLEKQKETTEKEYVFRPLAGTDITIAAEQAIRRANEGDRLVLAFNGAYIPVRKGCDANKIVDIYNAFIEKQKEQFRPDKCKGCNNVKGCINCVDGDQWAHIEEEQKPVFSDDIEREIRDWWLNGWKNSTDYSSFKSTIEHFYKLGEMKQKEQKPTEWSEETQKDIDDAAEYLRDYANNFVQGGNSKRYVLDLADRIESLTPKSKQEWSEEDEEIRKGCIELAMIAFPANKSARENKQKCIDWLKSLRPSWKPSEEQMGSLQVAAIESKTDFQTLTSLLIDLKKL